MPEFCAVQEPVLKAHVLCKTRNMPSLARLKWQQKTNELGSGGALPVGNHWDSRSGEDIVTMPEFCAVQEPVLKAIVSCEMKNMPSMARLKATYSRSDAAPQSAKVLQCDTGAAKLAQMPLSSSAALSGSRVEELTAAMGILDLSPHGFLQGNALETRCTSRAALLGSKENLSGQQHMAGPAAVMLRSLRDCSRKDVEDAANWVPVAPKLPRPEMPSVARPGRYMTLSTKP